jgi:PadR family transcriptional regulator PadR
MSEVEPSISGPPRRYYRITEAGQQALPRWRSIWQQTAEMVELHLKGVNRD